MELGTISLAQILESGSLARITAQEARTLIAVPPTSHASSGGDYGLTTQLLYGHAKASSLVPLPNSGSGAVGSTINVFALSDHVHPLQENIAGVASFAERLQYPRRFAMTGGATAEGVAFDGSGDLFLRVTRLDPYALDVPVPLEKGGTGATSAAGALAAIGAAPASHSHAAMTLASLGVTATATELNYCTGLTASIQTQLGGKSDTGHTHTPASLGAAATGHTHTPASLGAASENHEHDYAGSASPGGPATSALKATVLETPRVIKVGLTSKTFNGSANIDYTLAEIGAAATGHTHEAQTLQEYENFLTKLRTSGDTDNIKIRTSITENDVGYYVLIFRSYNIAESEVDIDFRLSFTIGNGVISNPALVTVGSLGITKVKIGFVSRAETVEGTTYNGSYIGIVIYLDSLYTRPSFTVSALSQDMPQAKRNGWVVDYFQQSGDDVYDGGDDLANALEVYQSVLTTLTTLGVTAAASELNICEGLTATTTELNHCHGVTRAIQTQLNEKAPTSHASETAQTYGRATATKYGHAKASSATPAALGTASAGTDDGAFARGDHVHQIPSLATLGAAATGHTHTLASLGAAASSHTHSIYLPLAGGNVTGNITLASGKKLNITGASGVAHYVSGEMVIGQISLLDIEAFRRSKNKTLREDDGEIATSSTSTTQLGLTHHTPGTDSTIHLVIGQTSGMSADFFRYINLPTLGTGALEGDRIEIIVTNRNPSYKGKIHFNPTTSSVNFRTIDGAFITSSERVFGSGERCTFYAIKETTSGALEWRVVKTAESKF